MGKDTPSAPTPVDPTTVINAAANASRVNQTGPGGSIGWTQGPGGQWTQTSSLSPNQTGLLDQSQHGASQSILDLKGANKSLQTGVNAPTLQTSVNNPGVPQSSLNLSGVQGIPQANDAAYNKAVDSVYNQATSRLDPQWAQQQTQLETQLANQGVAQNSDAWNKAMTQFTQGKNDAYTSAENNAITQGSGVESNLFNMGLAANQAGVGNAVTSGNFANSAAGQQLAQALSTAGFGNTAQEQMFSNGMANANLNNSATGQRTSTDLATAGLPGQYLNVSLPGTGQSPDALGAYSLNAQQQMAAYQAQTAQQSAKKGGMGSLAGTLGSAAILSDRRVKRDIKVIGRAENGLPIYSFRYAWDDKPQIGLMAQDVERKNPHAVVTIGGIKHVDYEKALAA